MKKVRLRFMITNNYDDSITITSSTGQDLKSELRQIARDKGKQVSDYTIKPYNFQ